MKNFLIVCAVAATVLGACGKKGGPGTKSDTTDSAKISNIPIDSLAFEVDTFHVIEKETNCEKGECGVCDLYYEKIKTPIKPVHDSVNKYIDTLMLYALNDMSSPKWGYDLKKRAKEFVEAGSSPEFAGFGGSWDWTHHTSIFRPVEEIIAVSSGWGGYQGGAHGNYFSETVNFFTSTGKRVKLEDLFTDLAALNAIGVVYFKKDNGLDADVDCMEQGWDFTDQEFALNNNFDVSTESITWQFNSYEIGPYSSGAPSVTIPIKELSKVMKIKLTNVKI
jgi:hypothetical protein